VHHFALLAGYGAEAVHPYLALETLERSAKGDAEKADKYVKNFVKAIGKGLLKVMSKMGISTYMSYTGAQIFEAIGLQKDFVDKYFTGTPTKVEGIGVFEVAEEAIRLHRPPSRRPGAGHDMLDAGGEYAFRIRGEEHMWTPDAIAKLQHATRSGKYDTYKEYAKLINDQTKRHMTLRGLFELKPPGPGAARRSRAGQGDRQALRHRRDVARLDLDRGAHHAGHRHEPHRRQVEHRRRRRGSERFKPLKAARWPESSASRASSATTAQGRRQPALGDQAGGLRPLRRDHRIPGQCRPDPDQDGAGRQARRRRPAARPQGVRVHRLPAPLGAGRRPDLAAAAPRHLLDRGSGAADPRPEERQPAASISVKLVSEVGVGTVAAGVAKAKADHVVIAGFDGGTGASPLSSIKHAGTPWELGLAETQQTLVLNRLRAASACRSTAR
jgi:glutamate synthase (NADPH/NADH) large chain